MDRISTIISAILTALSYQYFWPGIFVSFIPLIKQKLTPSSLFIWGSIYMGILHLFLLELKDQSNLFAAILLWGLATIYYGLFYGAGGLILMNLSKRINQSWLILLPVIWPLIELAKSSGNYGNPNGNIALSLSKIVHLIPSFSVIGHIAMGVLILCINIAIIKILENTNRKKYSRFLFITLILIVSLRSPTHLIKTNTSLSIIQTNVTQQKKLNFSQWPSIKKNYLDLMRKATGNIIVMPESIIPQDIKRSNFFNEIQTISTSNNKFILFGSFIEKTSKVYNGSYLIQPNGIPIEYKKQRLMPFGETLPFRKLLSKVIPKNLLFNDFDIGTEFIDVKIKNLHLRPLICLEGIYSEFYRSKTNSIVTVLANNAWFNKSSASNKLLKFSQIYAAEYQIPVLISANFGKSAFMDCNGKSTHIANHHKSEILTTSIKSNSKKSIYHQFPWLGIIFVLILWGIMHISIKQSK